MNDVKMMITMDYNHPSIFIWGVRLNESNDCPELYTRRNELAKRLDPDRAISRAVSLRKTFTPSMISAIKAQNVRMYFKASAR